MKDDFAEGKKVVSIPELKDLLNAQFDEFTLIELLEITNEEILHAFSDKIIEMYDKLVLEVMLEDELEDGLL